MNYCLAQIIQFAGITDGEDTFWIQILVLVVLGGVVGFGSLIKTRANRFKTQEQYQPEGAGRSHSQRGRPIEAVKELKDKYRGIFLTTAQPKTITEGPTFNFEPADAASEGKQKNEIGKARDRDVDSGMEILEPAFLLGVVENTKSDDKNNVMIRNLSFNELLRREQLAAVDSKALNVYAINDGNLYNKDIQCCAMKELAERTKVRS
ncbi:MAG TPA: hypothetical protein VMY06_08120 [Sedimentisphaerales bacterium]|nr:hypothetical protein [Sedimentisphaerales bacterium]